MGSNFFGVGTFGTPGATGRCGVLGAFFTRRGEFGTAEDLLRSRSLTSRPGLTMLEGGAPIVLDRVHGNSKRS